LEIEEYLIAVKHLGLRKTSAVFQKYTVIKGRYARDLAELSFA